MLLLRVPNTGKTVGKRKSPLLHIASTAKKALKPGLEARNSVGKNTF